MRNSTILTVLRGPLHGLGQGQMGSALRGSLQISCFLTEGPFLGIPLNLLLSSQKCQGVPFSPICQTIETFAAVTLVVTPFVRNPWPSDSEGPGPILRPESHARQSSVSGIRASACARGAPRARSALRLGQDRQHQPLSRDGELR